MSKSLEQKVKEHILKHKYTWTYSDIMEQYRKSLLGYYVSFTAKEIINDVVIPHFKERSQK